MTDKPSSQPGDQHVVAIDGPSGSGKSTVARGLAERLGYTYLDTGAMYRAVTWHFLSKGIGPESGVVAVEGALARLRLALNERGKVEIDNEDVSDNLRTREVEANVSGVSAMPRVREMMRGLQRSIAGAGPLVAEGRDMGSVVFPRARWKFYLDAEPEERARRRHGEYVERGRGVTQQEIQDEIQQRDRLDSAREDAPLTRAEGAVVIDTTHASAERIIADLLEIVRRDLD